MTAETAIAVEVGTRVGALFTPEHPAHLAPVVQLQAPG